MWFHLQAFQHELGARSNTVAFVRKRAKEMLDKSEHDMTQQQAELIELTTMWDRVCKLSVNKQEKLEQAHKLVSIDVLNLIHVLSYLVSSPMVSFMIFIVISFYGFLEYTENANL